VNVIAPPTVFHLISAPPSLIMAGSPRRCGSDSKRNDWSNNNPRMGMEAAAGSTASLVQGRDRDRARAVHACGIVGETDDDSDFTVLHFGFHPHPNGCRCRTRLRLGTHTRHAREIVLWML
jgi:hypothetical protein